MKMPRKEPAAGQSSAQAQQEAISEGIDSFELPRSLVTRIARSAVGITHNDSFRPNSRVPRQFLVP